MFLKILGILGVVLSIMGVFIVGIFQKAGETVGEEVGKAFTDKAKGMRFTPKMKRAICAILCACVLLCGVGYFLYCGLQFKWTLENGVLTLEKGFLSNGKMPVYQYVKPRSSNGNAADTYQLFISKAPWFNRRKEITHIILSDGITSVSSAAFAGCVNLEEIYIPNSLTSIYNYAFYEASSLKYIYFTNKISHIGEFAFSQCHSLTEVICSYSSAISNASGCVERFAFCNCENLKSIGIPDSITQIGDSAFENCSTLEQILLPDSVTRIGSRAFYNCARLPNIWLQGSVTDIGSEAFYGCSSLTEISIPDSVTYIGSYAFRECSSIISVKIPDSVTQIRNGTFWGCSSLKRASVPAYVEIGMGAFPADTLVRRR